MNIGELAKELNVSGKDVIAFLQENGFSCKSSKKNLDADTEALVRKNVSKIGQLSSDAETQPSKKNSKEKNDNTDALNEEKTIKEEKTKTEEKAIKEEMSKTEEKKKTEEKAESMAKDAESDKKEMKRTLKADAGTKEALKADAGTKEAQKSETEKKEEPVIKKKKNIIIVGGQRNKPNGMNNANRPKYSQPQQNNQTSFSRPVGPSSLIRPTTPPSPTPAKHFVPSGSNRPSENKNASVNKTETVNNTIKSENAQAVQNKENRPAYEDSQRSNGNKGNTGNTERIQNNANSNRSGFNQSQNGNRPNAERSQSGFNNRGGYNASQGGNRPNTERTQGGFNNRGGYNASQGGNRPNAERSQGGFNNRNGMQGNRGGFGQGGFNKDKDADDRNTRDIRFKKSSNRSSFGADAPVMDAEKHRDDEKRRISQEKDNKKNKKDYIYEEDGAGKGKGKGKLKPGAFIKPEKKVEEVVEEDIKVIVIPESLTIKDLAEKMKQQPAALIKKLFLKGEIVTLNQEISYEKAEEIAMEYDILCEQEVKVNVIEELLKEEEEDESVLTERPPVICVMGHVDHGKTSLLDSIRKTHVIDKEAGGITQHIGAYMVQVNDRKITFLDTPGHEAFTAISIRGANATDIAILVVAADDGVMPQTKEAINHAKAAGVQIIVAVNKVDKIGYDFNDPSRKMDSYPSINNLMRELAEDHDLLAEDWGGTTIFAPVSAKKGDGIPELLDMILLSADMLELKANAKRKARGLVIEAQLDRGRGPVATVLVQKGTLHVGDFISAGAAHGKVRAMVDDSGRRVKEAPPSTPVEILGLNSVPNAGEIFIAHANDKDAKTFAETFIEEDKNKLMADTKAKMSLDDLFSQIQAGNLKELNLIVKADVQGSVEAVKQSLVKLSNEEVAVKVVHSGVGTINESDVILASASKAIIIGFNVRLDTMAKDTVEKEGVDVRLYNVIYQAIEDVEAAMKGMLDPVFEEKVIGHAEVRQIFKASQVGNIAGSYVLDGVFQRDCKIRISREGEQIYEGKLASLKRFKDDVKEVKAGFECGLVFEDFDKIQELDIVEAYIMVEVPR
ncbi:MAG: translation initiation factor IF-2 [Lachnospiraceae bacterium]|nr:translation initiation factor IF-2 [Lachnospiraceae bacterium]